MGDVYDHDKRDIRRGMQERRAALDMAHVAGASASACALVLALPVFAAARHVVVYAAVGNEIDPRAIAERSWASAKYVYFPRPAGESPGFMRRHPTGQATGELLPADAGGVLFVVPGVAFDRHGVRLGRGGGWYDRAFAAHPGGTRIGLGFDFQLVPTLPEAPWDVRMHAVVTDARVVDDPMPVGAVKENGT